MSSTKVEVEGTLERDGIIRLDHKPDLPVGRVRVVIEHLPYDPEKDPFMIGLRAIHERLKASGHVPRTREEIDAEINEGRDADEERMRAIEKLHEEAEAARKAREPNAEKPS